MSVSIKGLEKVKLLKTLWEGAKPAAFFAFSGQISPAFDNSSAKEAIKDYIDYYCGRCIKTDLSGDTADPTSYDAEWGAGAFQKIAGSLSA
jgi:hypothetical protein